MTTKHATMTCRNAHTATTRAPGGPLVSRGGPGTFILREEEKKGEDKDKDDEERGLGSSISDIGSAAGELIN
jgi:hypothetical protein